MRKMLYFLFILCVSDSSRGSSSIEYLMTTCLVDGVTHETGTRWETQSCSTCTCYDGVTICSKKECTKSNCFDTYIPDGQCCPVCHAGEPCLFKGVTHKSGEEWSLSDDEPCVTCRCNNGLSTCVIKECAEPRCDKPILPKGECCAHCNDRPCNFNDIYYNHTSIWNVDECTDCWCDNGRVSCAVDACNAFPGCVNPVVLPNTCCPVCPHTIQISRVQVRTDKGLKLKAGKTTKIQFDVRVKFNKNMEEFDPLMTVTGSNLWTMSAWFSKHNRGAGRRFSYIYQVLDRQQSSTTAQLDSVLEIPSISYTLKSKHLSCKHLKYFCVNFDTADLPQYSDKGEAFMVEGHPSQWSLTGCKKYQNVKNRMLRNLIAGK